MILVGVSRKDRLIGDRFRILVVIVPNYCERDFNKSAEEQPFQFGSTDS
jgi:hypothetical protein